MEINKNYSSGIVLIAQVFLAIFIVIVTAFLVVKFCDHREISDQKIRDYALTLSLHYKAAGFDNLLREKRENLTYIFSTLLVTTLIFLSLFFSNKFWLPKLNKKNRHNLYGAVISFSALALIFVAAFSLISSRYILEFPQKIELYSAPFVIGFGFLLVLCTINYGVFSVPRLQLRIKVIFAICSSCLSLLVVSYGIFDENSLSLESYAINFNPVVEPIIQQYFGKAVLINSKSLYGLHPYFLQWVLDIFPANILTLSTSLALLFLVSLLSLAFFIFCAVENKFLALLGFMALLFVQNFAFDWWFLEGGVAFQYESIRLLFPCLLLVFLYFFCKEPNPKKYYAAVILFSLATMWNLDSGLPTFITLVLIGIYENSKSQFKIKSALNIFAKSLAIFITCWLTLIIFLKVKYGIWPHLSWMFYGQNMALNFAYAMLPMELAGLWWMVVLIYVIGLVISINNFLNKKHSLQNSLILSLTLLGIGSFSYFVGRSHEANLLRCSYPAVILLIIFSDQFCKKLQRQDLKYFLPKPKIEMLILAMPLLFICYLASACFFNLFSNQTLREKFITTKFAKASKPYFVQELEFIKQHITFDKSRVRDDILLITNNDQDFYFDLELRLKSPINIINIRHMFNLDEVAEIQDLITSQKIKSVIFIASKNKEVISVMSDHEIEELKKLLKKYYFISAEMQVGPDERLEIYEKIKS